MAYDPVSLKKMKVWSVIISACMMEVWPVSLPILMKEVWSIVLSLLIKEEWPVILSGLKESMTHNPVYLENEGVACNPVGPKKRRTCV